METILAVLICVLATGAIVLVTVIHGMGRRLDQLEGKACHSGIMHDLTSEALKAQMELLASLCNEKDKT